MALAPIQLISDFMEDYPNYWLKMYEQGTTTPLAMSIDKLGAVTVAKAEISAGPTPPLGLIKTAGNVTFIPYIDEAYDAYIFPTEAEADANDTVNAIQLADDVDFLQVLPNEVPGVLVANMVANTSLVVGDFVETVGYTTKGDSGDNTYEVVASGTATADGFTFIDLPNTTPATQAKALFPRGVRTTMQAGAIGDGVADDTIPLQTCLDSRLRVQMPAGTYRTTDELVWSNYSSLVGEAIFTGARFGPGGHDYDPEFNSSILYDGAGGTNSCVCRWSQAPVGDTFTDAGIPLNDSDLIAPEIDGILIDGNNKAEIGFYCYRATTGKYKAVVATQCLKHGQFFIGTFNGTFTDVLAYDNAEMGVTIGKNEFSWPSAEIAINALHFNGLTTRSNGTAKTYDEATNPEVGHGLFLSLGRGNTIDRISSSSNDGAGMYVVGQSTSGSNHINGVYTEGNMPDASGEGRATSLQEVIVESGRLLTGYRFSEMFVSNANGGRLRILDNLTEVLNPNFDQIMTFENCGSREFPVFFQSSTRQYRVVKSLADYSTGEPPWFTDYSNVFASGVYSQNNPVTSIVVEGMLVEADIVFGGSTGIATVTFDEPVFSSNYIVDCTTTSTGHRATATNITNTGFDIEMTNLSGTPTTAQQVRFSCRSIRWFTV